MDESIVERLITKDKKKAQAFILDASIRCAGLNINGSRCKKNAMNNKDMCSQHISQVGRVLVHCSGKDCFLKKIMPIYEDDDGSLFFDRYLCKSHDQPSDIRNWIKIKGISFFQVDSKCLKCGKKGGKTHGYYCPKCAPKAEYDVMKRCFGTTLNDERCSRQKIMTNNGEEYLCELHQFKKTKE